MPYKFQLPPVTSLTPDQQRAVEEDEPLALSGGPGTGKSVVCLWRHIQNHATGLSNSLLLTYTKTLEYYLRQSATSKDSQAGNSIDRIYWWLTNIKTFGYDEIIIDEGQDVNKEMFSKFFKYVNNVSYGADERQSMYLRNQELTNLINWFSSDSRFNKNIPITLEKNFRNSKEILLFISSLFPNYLIPHNTIANAKVTGIKPFMSLNLDWSEENHAKKIVEIINIFHSSEHNIAVLVPYAKKVDNYYALVRKYLDNNIPISKYQTEHENFTGIENVHITTFKSSKGTEFHTVIIPEFDNFSWVISNMDYISEKDYYVALTRAKTNLYLLCRNGFPDICNKNTVEIG